MDNYVITIARSYGSGGRTMGKMLAEELGIDCYDLDLLKLASEDSGINEALFGESDEKLKGRNIFKIVKGVYTGHVSAPGSDDFLSKENLFNYQAKVIKELADTTSCIIIGRCADYALADFDNCLSVFFHADLKTRIRRIAKIYDLTDAKAKDKIAKTDKRRASYYNYYTSKRWGDADSYDFCIDSGKMGIDGSVDLVLNAVRLKEKGYKKPIY